MPAANRIYWQSLRKDIAENENARTCNMPNREIEIGGEPGQSADIAVESVNFTPPGRHAPVGRISLCLDFI